MILKILSVAREYVAYLIDREPMLLYDFGRSEHTPETELLQSDLQAIAERLGSIRADNERYIEGVLDDLHFSEYGFSDVGVDHLDIHDTGSYKIPLLEKGKPIAWMGDQTDIFPKGVKHNWVPWDDRDSPSFTSYRVGQVPSKGYYKCLTASCYYCMREHRYECLLEFSESLYKMVLDKDGWVESDIGSYCCPACWAGLES